MLTKHIYYCSYHHKMKATEFLINEKFEINAKYRVNLTALKVRKNKKFPLGLKEI